MVVVVGGVKPNFCFVRLSWGFDNNCPYQSRIFSSKGPVGSQHCEPDGHGHQHQQGGGGEGEQGRQEETLDMMIMTNNPK